MRNSEIDNIFNKVEEEFYKNRNDNRVMALRIILKKIKTTNKQLEVLNKDLELAQNGEFLVIVEKYISPLAAEEYE